VERRVERFFSYLAILKTYTKPTDSRFFEKIRLSQVILS